MITNHTKYLVFVLFSIINTVTVLAADNGSIQDIDATINSSFNSVYENPDDAITLGNSIYDNNNYTQKTRVKALMLVSLAYTSKRDYQQALEYIEKANSLSKTINEPTLQIEIMFRMGTIYQQLKIYDKSLEYIEKTEHLTSLYPKHDPVRKFLANSYAVKGFIYKENLNCDIALDYFNKSIAEFLSISNNSYYTNLSIVFYNMGNCNTLQANYNEAKINFNKAITYGKDADAASLIAFAQKGLAEVYMLEGDYNMATTLLHDGLKRSSKVGDLILNLGLYKGLYETYLALNQWDDYQKYFDLFLKTQQKIKESERNSISDSLDQIHLNQTEQIETLESQLVYYIQWIISGVTLFLLIVFFLLKRNKKTINTLQKRVKNLQDIKFNASTTS
ncbi:tetratricopeptide repeat protein [Formosa sp. A9]|uniref:tetratricopeptide repeat protein n=1 Tax=Formosa sp. A9 TaxID=3442641 RepID=UPI003EBC57EF